MVKRFTKVKLYLTEENLTAQKVEDAEVLSWPSLKESKWYLLAPPSSIYFENLFSEAGNLYEQNRNRLLQKTGKKLLFPHHNLNKTIIGTFVH